MQTRPLYYLQTLTPTTPSVRTPLPDSGTDSSPNSQTSNKKEDSVTQPTGKCTQLVLPPKFYGLPKIHKIGTPRPIMSSRGSITYGVAKELAGIICPLVGQSPHHLKNTQHSLQHIQKARLEPEEVMASYNVKAPLNFSSCGPFNTNSPTKIITGPEITQQDEHVHSTHHHITGDLP